MSEADDYRAGYRFGALAWVTLPDGNEVTLKLGILLRPTYVHVFAPPIAAIAPAEKNAAHPAPWQAVTGRGDADTALVEILLSPEKARLLPLADDALKLIASMTRLLTARPVYLSGASDQPLSIAAARTEGFRLEAIDPVPVWREDIPELNGAVIDLLRTFLVPAGHMFSDDTVYQAFLLLDSVWGCPVSKLE